MLGDYGLQSGDFNFDAAEVGVEIFPNAISNVDARTVHEAEFGGSCGHVPADSPHRSRAFLLCQFEAEMTLFHDARRRDHACVTRDEDRFRIAMSQRFKLA